MLVLFKKKKNTDTSLRLLRTITETEFIHVTISDNSCSFNPGIGDASWSIGSDFDKQRAVFSFYRSRYECWSGPIARNTFHLSEDYFIKTS